MLRIGSRRQHCALAMQPELGAILGLSQVDGKLMKDATIQVTRPSEDLKSSKNQGIMNIPDFFPS
jgi:hypothetical protein